MKHDITFGDVIKRLEAAEHRIESLEAKLHLDYKPDDWTIEFENLLDSIHQRLNWKGPHGEVPNAPALLWIERIKQNFLSLKQPPANPNESLEAFCNWLQKKYDLHKASGDPTTCYHAARDEHHRYTSPA